MVLKVHKVVESLARVPTHNRVQLHTITLNFRKAACLWTEAKTPPKHGENMQTPQMQGRGCNRNPNPGGVREMY